MLYTYYVAKEVNFQTLAAIIAEVELSAEDGDRIDIVSLFTGELFASRYNFNLWEINI